MIEYNLSKPGNLRGYSFEYVVKVMLRRAHKNSFIFQMCFFDSIDELLLKNRLKYDLVQPIIEYMRLEWGRTDLIEFVLDSKENRNILKINFYDIKNQNQSISSDFFQICLSNNKFLDGM